MTSETMDASPTALGHLRVIEVVTDIGELFGKLMADLGADVVRVEAPGGDSTRRIGPFLDDEPHPERSLHFWQYNTNKRSVTLDLERPEGQALFWLLAEGADILVESMPSGYMDERGLSYDQLRKVNPRLIYVSISPFGRGGPRGELKGSDLVGWAASGYMYTTGWKWHPPTRPWGRQASHAGCLYAVSAAMAAIFHRWSSGEGQQVDVSLQEAVASTVEQNVPFYVGDHVIPGRRDNDHVNGLGGTKIIPCKDGWIHLNIGWRDGVNHIVEWINEDEMAEDLTDEKWLDDKYRRANIDQVVRVVSTWAKGKTRMEFFHEGQRRGLECGPINTIPEAFDDLQLESRGYWIDVEHREMGRSFKYPGAPYRLTETPWSVRRRAPLIGEDNATILGGELGLSSEELSSLAESGVI